MVFLPLASGQNNLITPTRFPQLMSNYQKRSRGCSTSLSGSFLTTNNRHKKFHSPRPVNLMSILIQRKSLTYIPAACNSKSIEYLPSFQRYCVIQLDTFSHPQYRNPGPRSSPWRICGDKQYQSFPFKFSFNSARNCCLCFRSSEDVGSIQYPEYCIAIHDPWPIASRCHFTARESQALRSKVRPNF
jgi:hypothetical protein